MANLAKLTIPEKLAATREKWNLFRGLFTCEDEFDTAAVRIIEDAFATGVFNGEWSVLDQSRLSCLAAHLAGMLDAAQADNRRECTRAGEQMVDLMARTLDRMAPDVARQIRFQ